MICWIASRAAARFCHGWARDWVTTNSSPATPAASPARVPCCAWRSTATRMVSRCAATVASHGPDPGAGEDRVERGGEVRSPVADHELDSAPGGAAGDGGVVFRPRAGVHDLASLVCRRGFEEGGGGGRGGPGRQNAASQVH